jgi:hypothetical protein
MDCVIAQKDSLAMAPSRGRLYSIRCRSVSVCSGGLIGIIVYNVWV